MAGTTDATRGRPRPAKGAAHDGTRDRTRAPRAVLVAAVAALLALASTAAAGSPDAGRAGTPPTAGGELERTFHALRPRAGAGDPVAQFNLGVLYERLAVMAELGIPLSGASFPVEPDAAGNILRAYAWYAAAAGARLVDARDRREALARRLTAFERHAAARWVEDWLGRPHLGFALDRGPISLAGREPARP